MIPSKTSVASCFALLCGTATASFGQAQPVHPQFYLWSEPPIGWVGDERFAPMVRVQILGNSLTLAQSAEATSDAVLDRIDELRTEGWLVGERVCVLLQNFGSPQWGGYTQFRDPADAVDVDLDNVGGPDWPISFDVADCLTPGMWESCYPEQFQPWMGTGTGRVRDWTEAFLVELEGGLADPDDAPVRFHFDSEVHLNTTGSANWPFLLRCMYLDGSDKWNSEPVLGGNGYAKMADYWETACNAFAEEYDDLDTLFSLTDPNPWDLQNGPQVINFSSGTQEGFHVRANRDLFNWWSGISWNAVEGAMEYTAYQPIKAVFPECLVSNYAITRLAPGEQWVDWTWDLDGLQDDSPSFTHAWTRAMPRGFSDDWQHGIRHFYTSSGRWYLHSNRERRGDFDAPVLYPFGAPDTVPSYLRTESADSTYADAYRYWDVYRKPSGSPSLPPRETAWDASLRNHRRWLESVIETGYEESDEHPEEKLAPWIPMPWVLFHPTSSQSYEVLPEDVTSLMQLLRSKRVPEILMWDATGYGEIPEGTSPYEMLKEVYDAVYSPVIESYETEYGTEAESYDESRLEDTLSRAGSGGRIEHSMKLASETVYGTGSPMTIQDIASTVVEFSGIADLGALWLRLEGSARPSYQEEGIVMPYGRIYVWRWNTETWVELRVDQNKIDADGNSVDDFDINDGYCFRFWAPEDPPEIHASEDRWFSMRRNFSWSPTTPPNVVSNTGHVRLKIVGVCQLPFEVKWDLVQIRAISPTMTPGFTENESEFSEQGSDVNYDEVLDSLDTAEFMGEWLEEGRAADLNGDSAVDEADIVRFFHGMPE